MAHKLTRGYKLCMLAMKNKKQNEKIIDMKLKARQKKKSNLFLRDSDSEYHPDTESDCSEYEFDCKSPVSPAFAKSSYNKGIGKATIMNDKIHILSDIKICSSKLDQGNNTITMQIMHEPEDTKQIMVHSILEEIISNVLEITYYGNNAPSPEDDCEIIPESVSGKWIVSEILDAIICHVTKTSQHFFLNNVYIKTIHETDSTQQYVSEILTNIIDECVNISCLKQFTKKGTLRKRKSYDLSVTERKRQKLEKKKQGYNLKVPCKIECQKKCIQKIDQHRRQEINRLFWEMNKNEQKNFVLNTTAQTGIKRKTTDAATVSRRSKSFLYYFKDEQGATHNVCKIFFLATLGYEPKNDRFIRDILNTSTSSLVAKPDLRGKHSKTTKIDRQIIMKHIESFNPRIAHYRREHAPNRKYLPSDINITMMNKDFLEKHPSIDVSYCLYRNVISSMNISFVKLGHEECWACELFDVHKTNTGHTKEDPKENCAECKKFICHRKRYREARRIYQEDETKANDSNLIVSADLQKVIMLPRLEMFKEAIFTPRIVAFNESFVPIGKKQRLGPTAVIWHEATSGRSAKDIISTFYAFFLSVRDVRHITLWLDNCSGQNKNWVLFCFFVFMVNFSEVELQTIQVKYFEPGHTFMAADSFHHQVEKSLKHMSKVYDFKDFSEAVCKASHKVNIIEMEVHNFYDWEDAASQYKLGKIKPRPYMHDMVQVNFERGNKALMYKTEFDSPAIEINFLNARCMKVGMSKPRPKNNPKGITIDRKSLIISKLVPIMPKSRRKFWENLPTATDEHHDSNDDN